MKIKKYETKILYKFPQNIIKMKIIIIVRVLNRYDRD